MNKIYNSIEELVGNTPIIELHKIEEEPALSGKIFAKLEMFNPAGSVKDRIALNMIEMAEKSGRLKKGMTIIEPTSGNTGIGLASIAAAKGYKTIFTMPETMSIERRKLLAGYGGKIVLSEGKLGMKGSIAKAKELNEQIEGSIILGQFENPDNPKAHEKTTGPEIWEATDGKVDIFVAGVGTGGTITGTGRFLKQKNKGIKIVAVEPSASPVISGGKPGAHMLQGIGAGFIPETLDASVIDEIITIDADDAFESARLLAHKEGILVGISSGAALHAAITLAKREENKDKAIVVVLPDTGERYLSTPLFTEG